MKKIFMLAACAMFAGCEKMSISNIEESEASETKKFTFTLKGDFASQWKPVTRGYLAADGKDLTDVWVLDYVDGQLVQQLHQSDNAAADFGRPSMSLTMGAHHVYFVASRGTSPTLDTVEHTIVFGKPSDTFWADYEVTVVPTSNGNRAVTLDRVATKLRLTITDPVAADAAVFNITPATWYYGLDYMTGLPCAVASEQAFPITIPADRIGQTGTVLSIYGISSAAEWTTNVAVDSRNANGDVLGSITITGAPFRANRATEYSGPLFGSSGTLAVSLNAEWADSYEGIW